MTIDGDPACFTLRQDDSSRNVTENRAVCQDPDSVPLVEIHPQVGEAMTPATPHRPPVVRPSTSRSSWRWTRASTSKQQPC
jgi:hypothetical protein